MLDFGRFYSEKPQKNRKKSLCLKILANLLCKSNIFDYLCTAKM